MKLQLVTSRWAVPDRVNLIHAFPKRSQKSELRFQVIQKHFIAYKVTLGRDLLKDLRISISVRCLHKNETCFLK